MIFNYQTVELGGKIIIPKSFMNKKEGEIINKTHAGISVIYDKNKSTQQVAFYSYAWLNIEYGGSEKMLAQPTPSETSSGLPNDSIPF